MYRFLKLLVTTKLAFLLLAPSAHAISVTQNNNAAQLANQLLGPGVSLVGAPSLTGGAIQAGTFTNGTSEVGFFSGVVLSSGDVNQIPGVNVSSAESVGSGGSGSNSLSTNVGTGGDGDLNTLSGVNTFDASVLDGVDGFRIRGDEVQSIAGAGDINGDGFDDLLVESTEYVRYSSSTGPIYDSRAAVILAEVPARLL